jgi:hypothetical protein
MVAYLQEMYVCVLGGLSVGNVNGNAGSLPTHAHTHTHTHNTYTVG